MISGISTPRSLLLLWGAIPVSAVLGFLSSAYLARSLGPASLGFAQLAIVIGTYATLVADPGLTAVGRRDASMEPSGVFGQPRLIVWARLRISLLLLALSTPLLIALPLVGELRLAIAISLAGVALASFDLAWWNQAKQRQTATAVARVVVSTAFLGALLALVRGPGDAHMAVAATVIAGIAGVVVYGFAYRTRTISPDPPTPLPLARLLRRGMSLGLAATAIAIYTNADFIMLGLLRSPGDVGQYGAAYRLINGLLAFAAAYNLVVVPHINRLAGTADRLRPLLKKSIALSGLVVLPALVGGTLTADRIIDLVYGDVFRPAGLYFAILLFAAAVIALCSHSGWTLIALRRDRQYLGAVSVGGAANIGLNALLIPAFGPAAAAATTVVAELLVFAATMWFARDALPLRYFLPSMRVVMATLLMALVMIGLAPFGLLPQMLIGGVTYMVAIIAFYGSPIAPEFRWWRDMQPVVILETDR